MNRRLLLTTCALALAGLATLPAQAAAPKPKPFKGSYALHMNPDPTGEATGSLPDGTAGRYGCTNLNDDSTDKHPLTIPGAGTLKVVLDSPNPVPANAAGTGTDWDLFLTSPADDELLAESASGVSHEEITLKFPKATKLVVEACNLLGQPDATVTYSFKP